MLMIVDKPGVFLLIAPKGDKNTRNELIRNLCSVSTFLKFSLPAAQNCVSATLLSIAVSVTGRAISEQESQIVPILTVAE